MRSMISKTGLLAGLFVFASAAMAAGSGTTPTGGGSTAGIGAVAATVTGNLANIALLITAASYVGGMGLILTALIKFKGHKDAPTQVHLSVPIVLLFVGAAMLFIPSVFSTTGATLFSGGQQAGIAGVKSF